MCKGVWFAGSKRNPYVCIHVYTGRRYFGYESTSGSKKVIKELYPDIKVGLTLSLHDMQPATGGEDAAHKEWEEEFSHYLPYIAEDDFLGVQSYTRQCFDEKGNKYTPEGVELTQMGYEFYPQAIANVVRAAAKEFKGDLIVTENGVATADDSRRQEYIKEATTGLQACITDGIPLKGYLHWSLMDNFEWQKRLFYAIWPDCRRPQ